ncbi:MAG: glycerol kinase [Gammaproteobacteria bacterium]|jgi:glycerol kinase|nr:glycerol kinase [Gammaproteobacteria bacterium]
MADYILAIDQGTTSTRAIIFSTKRGVLNQQQIELKQHFPEPGWVEHDAEEIWSATLNACRNVLVSCKMHIGEIAALGISNQRETTVLWDKNTGKPVYNAIVWHDRRTANLCKQLAAEGLEQEIQAKTGLLLDPYFSASKIKWLLDTIPGLRQKAEAGEIAFGTIDSYLLYRLSGGKCHATDATNASRTLLFNLHTQDWDPDLLKLFDIPAQILPQVLDSNATFAKTDIDLLGAEIPITGIMGDQQAALLGQACLKPGMIKGTYGTGCFLLMHTGDKFIHSQHRMLTTVAARLSGKVSYAIEGSTFAAGATVQWLRDALHLIKTAKETEQIAAHLPHTSGVYLVPAFAGLGAPYWDPMARGAILGLTRDTGIAHIVRAALESICYQTKDLLTCIEIDSGINAVEIRVDGGMVANNWLMQFLANILGITIIRPKIIESSVLGVAYLAALGAGIYSSVDEIAKQWQSEQNFTSQIDMEQAIDLYAGWKQAVKRICNTPNF